MHAFAPLHHVNSDPRIVTRSPSQRTGNGEFHKMILIDEAPTERGSYRHLATYWHKSFTIRSQQIETAQISSTEKDG